MILRVPADGPTLDVAGATDLIGDAWAAEAEWVVIPATRLGPDFFTLKTRVAGEITQKFANYRLKLAVVGDTSAHDSDSLRAFIAESNRGAQLWFAADEAEFEARLR
ncbi:DUF4180 domain-containing protein [Actinokineospora sp. G85]|uniref:DUF4180 domain-containing protein n=1 Tax=Actinokineospora sp. G85 TaxID=3406626 RepID=UPI003C78F4F8